MALNIKVLKPDYTVLEKVLIQNIKLKIFLSKRDLFRGLFYYYLGIK